jgi:hypothetical protein
LRETLSRIKDKNGARFTYNRLNCCVAAYERAVRWPEQRGQVHLQTFGC